MNYLATGTRADITYTTSRLSEANAGPSPQHRELLKHLFRYLTGTLSLGLVFGGDSITIDDLRLHTFADASFADDLLTRYSTGGHVVFLAGGPIVWKSKKQTFTAISSTEAEFTNLTPAAQAAQWVWEILKEYGTIQPIPLILYTDSANARANVLNPLNAARTRCIDIRYKWVIDRVRKKMVDLRHLPGTDMTADGLTKPLQKEKHAQFVTLLGLVDIQIPWIKENIEASQQCRGRKAIKREN